jgi:hypothetical protein
MLPKWFAYSDKTFLGQPLNGFQFAIARK